jgi:cytochrome P450
LQGFSRLVLSDYAMNEVVLPAGSRAIVFYGAANRDERKYSQPHKFQVERNPADHVAFGTGPHACVGLHLAKLEMVAIFTALAARVKRFLVHEDVRHVHNVLRGFERLLVSVD